ncbi:L-histidine N(alpha)-methyltransferase [Lyngbya confervoides]|uniref:L-histidine N(Alpha)-methyltransferase n=1 Tax=Lyngbya confervoides BDU141951 TaxID=1574623 RepID=A0ABD4T8E3_9CYAN|nr:L-histidine N(alpha)-methyltransferase [Lyngbya confervoides]MCM1984780.1 L-histidine N(alpha)-methyltransferase [Lyngbya confervoides BDU141951]
MPSLSTPQSDRLQWIVLNPHPGASEREGADVLEGLSQTPKTLPCRYFYDDLGSLLFEQITELPEYYPTRLEQQILEHSAAAIAQRTGPCDLIELGSGSSRKTRLLLDAYCEIDPHPTYYPIDVSRGILKQTAHRLLTQYLSLSVVGLAGTYRQALEHLPAPDQKPRLLMFLGSTLGNLDTQRLGQAPSEQDVFFQQVTSALNPGDYLLLGVDLQKPVTVLERAYNDSQGITAQFNLNILRHLNRAFAGTFNLDQFTHCARYNPLEHQIEMYLESQRQQDVWLRTLDFTLTLQPGEQIRTEISRKFEVEALTATLLRHHLQRVNLWQDQQGWFAVLLFRYQG